MSIVRCDPKKTWPINEQLINTWKIDDKPDELLEVGPMS